MRERHREAFVKGGVGGLGYESGSVWRCGATEGGRGLSMGGGMLEVQQTSLLPSMVPLGMRVRE